MSYEDCTGVAVFPRAGSISGLRPNRSDGISQRWDWCQPVVASTLPQHCLGIRGSHQRLTLKSRHFVEHSHHMEDSNPDNDRRETMWPTSACRRQPRTPSCIACFDSRGNCGTGPSRRFRSSTSPASAFGPAQASTSAKRSDQQSPLIVSDTQTEARFSQNRSDTASCSEPPPQSRLAERPTPAADTSEEESTLPYLAYAYRRRSVLTKIGGGALRAVHTICRSGAGWREVARHHRVGACVSVRDHHDDQLAGAACAIAIIQLLPSFLRIAEGCSR